MILNDATKKERERKDKLYSRIRNMKLELRKKISFENLESEFMSVNETNQTDGTHVT